MTIRVRVPLRWRVGLLAAVAGIIVAAVCWLAPSPSAPARMAAAGARAITVDLGSIRPGATVERRVKIRNDGAARWTLKSMGSDCGCTVQKLDPETVEPGSEATLAVSYQAPDDVGAVERRIVVAFHESDAPTHLVLLQGAIRAWADASPAALQFGEVLSGTSADGHIEVVTVAPNRIDPTRATVDWPNANCTLVGQKVYRDATTGADATVSRFKIHYAPPPQVERGFTRGQLVIRSDGDPPEELRVPLTATIESPVRLDGSQFFFGFVAVDRASTQTVRLVPRPSAGRRFDLRDATVRHDLGDALTLQVQPDGESVVLQATLTPQSAARTVIGRVTVSRPGIADIHIPVSAYVKEVAGER